MTKLSNKKLPARRSGNKFPVFSGQHNRLAERGIFASQKRKFDIFRTFELFNKENMGILKDKIVEIIMVESDNIFAKNKKMFNIDFIKDKSARISVFNDKPAYELLSNTWKRYKMKYGNLNDKNNKSGIFDQLSGS